MFAAAADAACDFLCSGDQDWMAASVIGPVILAGAPPSAYGRVGRIGTLRAAGDSFRACGFVQ